MSKALLSPNPEKKPDGYNDSVPKQAQRHLDFSAYLWKSRGSILSVGQPPIPKIFQPASSQKRISQERKTLLSPHTKQANTA